MGYVITDGKSYIQLNNKSRPCKTTGKGKATIWYEEGKALNYLKSCGKDFRKFYIKYVNTDVTKGPSDSMKDRIVELKEFSGGLERRHTYLSAELSKIDKVICDLQHAAEFYKLNASQGYKLYKMLHDSMNKRRRIKNEMYEIHIILDAKISGISIEDTEKKLIETKDRVYTPRILNELFK